MESIDEFFSPEALRLLNQEEAILLPPDLPDEVFDFGESLSPPVPPHFEAKEKAAGSSHAFPGCSTISPADGRPSKRQRKHFDPERRKDVAETRKKGACLRCRVLKTSVSITFPLWPMKQY